MQAVAEKGYAAATVADAVRLARVSRGTFYALFDSKEACLAAAYRPRLEVLEERITRGRARRRRTGARSCALGLRAYLRDARGRAALRARATCSSGRRSGREREARAAPLRRPLRARPSRARGGPCRPTTRCSCWRPASTSSPARGVRAGAATSPTSRTPWWAAPCGSPRRRNHGPDVQRRARPAFRDELRAWFAANRPGEPPDARRGRALRLAARLPAPRSPTAAGPRRTGRPSTAAAARR